MEASSFFHSLWSNDGSIRSEKSNITNSRMRGTTSVAATQEGLDEKDDHGMNAGCCMMHAYLSDLESILRMCLAFGDWSEDSADMMRSCVGGGVCLCVMMAAMR
jgi:hypothetical protein